VGTAAHEEKIVESKLLCQLVGAARSPFFRFATYGCWAYCRPALATIGPGAADEPWQARPLLPHGLLSAQQHERTQCPPSPLSIPRSSTFLR
jgi:hypothetical protein